MGPNLKMLILQLSTHRTIADFIVVDQLPRVVFFCLVESLYKRRCNIICRQTRLKFECTRTTHPGWTLSICCWSKPQDLICKIFLKRVNFLFRFLIQIIWCWPQNPLSLPSCFPLSLDDEFLQSQNLLYLVGLILLSLNDKLHLSQSLSLAGGMSFMP